MMNRLQEGKQHHIQAVKVMFENNGNDDIFKYPVFHPQKKFISLDTEMRLQTLVLHFIVWMKKKQIASQEKQCFIFCCLMLQHLLSF